MEHKTMADFMIAYKKTMADEGSYSNDPGDAGQETWAGVARNFWPNWPGWQVIDSIKSEYPNDLDGAIQVMAKDTNLEINVRNFYKEQFWNRFLGDQIASQGVANRMFNISVNCGVGKAMRFLQYCLNALNFSPKIHQNLIEDGVFGNNTFNALSTFLNSRGKFEPELVAALEGKQRVYYLDIASQNPDQRKFIIGWMRRTI
jgi:lysozyme family protein